MGQKQAQGAKASPRQGRPGCRGQGLGSWLAVGRCVWLCAWLLSLGWLRGARAEGEGSDAIAEVTVNGPSGATLRVDGQEVGTLPLLDALRLPAGPHRFRVERGSQRAESDVLNLPGGRQAELNLTFSGRQLVAVLSITPAVLLWIAPAPDAATQRIWQQVIGQAARQEHAVLLSAERQAELLRKSSGLRPCIESGDCLRPLSREGELAYVLLLRPTATQVGLQLVDVRTRDVGAELAGGCPGCSLAQQAAQAATLARKALGQMATRARGQLSVTSSPSGAQVRLDGRLLGQTPLLQEAFVGTRRLAIELRGYQTDASEVEVEPGQTATVARTLSKPGAGAGQDGGSGDGRRPLWRIAVGASLIGAGGLLVGLGGSALAVNGRCQDSQADPQTCSPYYQTTGVGSGLLVGGLALSIGGAVLIALPGRRAAGSKQASRLSLAITRR
jgi:hypothetical protein